MVTQQDKRMIHQIIERYLNILRENNIPLWRVYLYGSWAKGGGYKESDIDIAVFWDKDTIDGFDEDVQLLKLTRRVDLRIEPHSFARTDFDEFDPYVNEIVKTGERIV